MTSRGLYRNMGDRNFVKRYLKFTEEEVQMDLTFSVTLEGKGVNKSRLRDVLVLFEALYFSAAGVEMCFIRLVFYPLWVEFARDVRV